MARNNTNRPRNNNSRRLSFIPQPGVFITEREDIPTSTDYYIDSHPWEDFFTFLDMSSTSPVQSVPLEPDEVSPSNSDFMRTSSARLTSHYVERMTTEGIMEILRLSNISMRRSEEEPIIYGERFDNIIIIPNDIETSVYRTPEGWGRGYVILNSNNLLIEASDSGMWREDYSLLEVHGGITYTASIDDNVVESRFGKSLHLTDDDIGNFIIGFGTNHHNSDKLLLTRESVLEETMKLALQCAAY